MLIQLGDLWIDPSCVEGIHPSREPNEQSVLHVKGDDTPYRLNMPAHEAAAIVNAELARVANLEAMERMQNRLIKGT